MDDLLQTVVGVKRAHNVCKWGMHPAQKAMIENYGFVVVSPLTEEVHTLPVAGMYTLAGLDIICNPHFPKSDIWGFDAEGKVVVKITNLPIPKGYCV